MATAAALEPLEVARSAGLRYTSDTRPGIRRRRAGKGWSYADADGRPIRDKTTLLRIRRLAIPPAWAEVWISPDPLGHLQATGRDARGRKQYRYHERWREIRDENKYDRMLDFARALPRIRARTAQDLRRQGLPKEKVLAAVVRLLETTLIRIGNEEYARENESFGLTTMRSRHVEVSGSKLAFRFRGKSGKEHEIRVVDRRLARVVARCQELPGQELFQCVGEDGEVRSVSSEDVNAYLRDISGEDFTAKDFRTWAGTVLAAAALREAGAFEGPTQAKKRILAAIDSVAKRLGNTRAICRKSYIHPAVLECYLDGSLATALTQGAGGPAQGPEDLTADEVAVLALLADRLGARPDGGAA